MKPEITANIQKMARAIRKAKKVSVVSSVDPDETSIACLSAMGLALSDLGKHFTLLSPDGVPTRFQFLPGSELILSETDETADVTIAVDSARKTIQVSRRHFTKPFAKIQIIEEILTVEEIIHELIRALGVEVTQAAAR